MNDMNKKKIAKICDIISIGFVIVFVVKTGLDYRQYVSSFGSAPFSVWIFVNAIFYLIPAIIAAIIGIVVSKRD